MIRYHEYDKAIIGVSMNTSANVLVYDYDLCLKICKLIHNFKNDFECLEYFDFNIMQAGFGKNKEDTPIFVRKHDSIEEIKDFDYY